MSSQECEHCGHAVPLEWERCPHCARPGLFSNVRAAELPEEVAALEERYRSALASAARRGCTDRIRQFETRTAGARVVLNRSCLEAARLVSSDRELQATFYQQVDAEIRLPYGEKWDLLRRMADEALFPGYKEKIRFAALTLDDTGLFHFGECALFLREDMISHRSSVFEENSAVFLKLHNYDAPLGCKAVWSERSKLCVAKLADAIELSISDTDFPALLLSNGETPEEDRFIEVHIWGPLSIFCLEGGIVRQTPFNRALVVELQDRFRQAGLQLRGMT